MNKVHSRGKILWDFLNWEGASLFYAYVAWNPWNRDNGIREGKGEGEAVEHSSSATIVDIVHF